MPDITTQIQGIIYEVGKILYGFSTEIVKILPDLLGRNSVIATTVANAIGDNSLGDGLSLLITGISFILLFAMAKRFAKGMQTIFMVSGIVAIISLVVFLYFGKGI